MAGPYGFRIEFSFGQALSAGDLTTWNNEFQALVTGLGLSCGDTATSSGGSLLIKKDGGDVDPNERKEIVRFIVNDHRVPPDRDALKITRDVCNVCEKPGLPPECDCFA